MVVSKVVMTPWLNEVHRNTGIDKFEVVVELRNNESSALQFSLLQGNMKLKFKN